jgi:hypothetical protein
MKIITRPAAYKLTPLVEVAALHPTNNMRGSKKGDFQSNYHIMTMEAEAGPND